MRKSLMVLACIVLGGCARIAALPDGRSVTASPEEIADQQQQQKIAQQEAADIQQDYANSELGQAASQAAVPLQKADPSNSATAITNTRSSF